MTERSYQEAVQILRDRFGNQLEGTEDAGRSEMERVLARELGIEGSSARAIVDELIQTGQIRYQHEGGQVPGSSADTEGPGGPILASPNATGAGLPAAPVDSTGLRPGYWEIGRSVEDRLSGRHGQVMP